LTRGGGKSVMTMYTHSVCRGRGQLAPACHHAHIARRARRRDRDNNACSS
jgi:hypothetical protein